MEMPVPVSVRLFLPHRFARNREGRLGVFHLGGNDLTRCVMLLKTATSLAFATACLTAIATLPAHAQMAAPGAPGTEVVTNGPQGSPPPNWSARQNVIESQRYDRLLEMNRGFRQARMRKECGPITDPQLREQC